MPWRYWSLALNHRYNIIRMGHSPLYIGIWLGIRCIQCGAIIMIITWSIFSQILKDHNKGRTAIKSLNISCTNYQNLNVSCLVLQLSLPNLLKPGVKLRMKMWLAAMLQLHLSDQQIDQSHRYGHHQAACRETAGSYDKTSRTAICFEHKTQYLLICVPYTRIVVFWHISNIPPMISQSQISCNTPTLYITAIFVRYCYTTGSWLL